MVSFGSIGSPLTEFIAFGARYLISVWGIPLGPSGRDSQLGDGHGYLGFGLYLDTFLRDGNLQPTLGWGLASVLIDTVQ